MRVRQSVEERFWAKVDKTSSPDGCWLWTGACKSDGYGVFYITECYVDGVRKQTFKLAHVYAYEQAHGPVPDGCEVDHVWESGCRNRRCVNSDAHLEAVTHLKNIRRSKWVRENFCRRRHPRTPENTRYDRKGRRICIICRKITERARRDRRRAEREREAELRRENQSAA